MTKYYVVHTNAQRVTFAPTTSPLRNLALYATLPGGARIQVSKSVPTLPPGAALYAPMGDMRIRQPVAEEPTAALLAVLSERMAQCTLGVYSGDTLITEERNIQWSVHVEPVEEDYVSNT